MKKILLGLVFINAFIFNSAFAEIKIISFAMEATYPPFEYTDVSGKIQGFDVDIANALCQRIKAQCTFTSQPFDSLIPSLKVGKFDALISAMNITDARKQQVDFTKPYYEPTVSFIAAGDKKINLSPEGLKDKTLGVQNGSTMEQYAQAKYGKVAKIKSYASLQDALLDLTTKRLDLVLGDTPIIMDWIKSHGQNQYAIVDKPFTDVQFFGPGDGIAVRKGNTELLNALNKALDEIKADGTYAKIQEKYFPAQK